ncbi:hypothetical protein WJX84_007118 [Apatococcus fuscideae]|uniref:Malic enzyme n=1 Tax=Apatococcus fuscideae TaxID=2026836 RepID=A0AAW1SL39_9CHLO
MGAQRRWGGVREPRHPNAVLPSEQDLDDWCNAKGLQKAEALEWIKTNVFPDRDSDRGEYKWTLTFKPKGHPRQISKPLHALYLAINLAYLQEHGLTVTPADLTLDILSMRDISSVDGLFEAPVPDTIRVAAHAACIDHFVKMILQKQPSVDSFLSAIPGLSRVPMPSTSQPESLPPPLVLAEPSGTETNNADQLQVALAAHHAAGLDHAQPGPQGDQGAARPFRRKAARAPLVDTSAAPYILHHKRLRALAVEGYQMKDSLLLPEGKARWVIVSRAITESVGLSYDDCTSGRFCKGPTFPNYDQRMQSVIKDLASMSINTHKQYWPKLSMIVVFLVESAAREPATTPEITPARFLAFLQHEDRRREDLMGKFVCKPEITSPGPAEGQESGTPAAAMATSSAAAEQAGAEGSTPAPAVLGMQTIKQFMSAASLLQSMQQRMLRADFTPASIAHDASVSKEVKARMDVDRALHEVEEAPGSAADHLQRMLQQHEAQEQQGHAVFTNSVLQATGLQQGGTASSLLEAARLLEQPHNAAGPSQAGDQGLLHLLLRKVFELDARVDDLQRQALESFSDMAADMLEGTGQAPAIGAESAGPEGSTAGSGAMPSGQPWMKWEGTFATLNAYPAINVLVDEWLYGIQLPHGRTPPLRDLEHAALLQPTTSYRWGSAMAKAVQLRKAIIYDVLRRASILCPNAPLTDVTQPGSGSFSPAALDQACAELEDLRRQLGDTEEDKPMSMNQLSVNLLRTAQPTQFEQQFLALRDPQTNMGVATPLQTRQARHMTGLLPPAQGDLVIEIDRAKAALEMRCSDLEKYQALMALRESNEAAFYGLLAQDLPGYLPLVYTPTVGQACQSWSKLLPRPTGLYISANDQGRISSLLANWPEHGVRIAVITDGERILGIGDLGANGMGISVGKSVVYAAAGVQPHQILPITVDVGCNASEIREDPLYIGLRQKRLRGSAYDALLDELVASLQQRYGPSLLVHWEDLSAANSFRTLARLQKQGVATFNDDIQSTGAATLAAVLGATRLPGVPALPQQRFLLYGAGQANIGAAQLLQHRLQQQGMSPQDAKSHLWLFDSQGVVFEGRKIGRMTPDKARFARPRSEAGLLESLGKDLRKAVEQLRPTALIGAAAIRGAFSQDVLSQLSQVCRATRFVHASHLRMMVDDHHHDNRAAGTPLVHVASAVASAPCGTRLARSCQAPSTDLHGNVMSTS